jgi:hypothetical protein
VDDPLLLLEQLIGMGFGLGAGLREELRLFKGGLKLSRNGVLSRFLLSNVRDNARLLLGSLVLEGAESLASRGITLYFICSTWFAYSFIRALRLDSSQLLFMSKRQRTMRSSQISLCRVPS